MIRTGDGISLPFDAFTDILFFSDYDASPIDEERIPTQYMPYSVKRHTQKT